MAGYRRETRADGQTPETGKYPRWKGKRDQRQCKNRVDDIGGLERLLGALGHQSPAV